MKHTVLKKAVLFVIFTCFLAACSAVTVFAESGNPEGVSAQAANDPDRQKKEKIVSLVNQERAKAGLKEVTIDETMMTGANIRAKEIQSLFSHTRPDGRDCFSVFTDLGISSNYRGENVLYASICSPETVMSGWMSSEGHKGVILDARFTRIGVGYFESSGIGYWVQIFAE